MPRSSRKLSFSNTYHVIMRASDRQQLFENSSDYDKYIQILELYKQRCGFDLYAYCLMSNHVHLLIHVNSVSLSSVFQQINTYYSMWFNAKYDRTGFLLQNRFFSEPVENDAYLFAVMRYIHQNPVKAGLEKSVGSTYEWSSYNAYICNNNDLVDTEVIISKMNNIDEFINYHEIISNDIIHDIDNMKKRISDDAARAIIEDISGCRTVTDFQNLTLIKRDQYLIELYQRGLSLRQLNRLTGIPRGVIERIL